MERSQRSSWPANAAAAWAFIFGIFHMVWAAGWYPLLDAEQARAAFAVLWKWIYDVVAGVLCFVAVPVALAPVSAWGQRVSRRLVFVLACCGSGLLILRAVASIVQSAYLLVIGRFRLDMFLPWEPWFYLGALLFGLSTWRSRPAARAATS